MTIRTLKVTSTGILSVHSLRRTATVLALALSPALIGAHAVATPAIVPQPVWDVAGTSLLVWIQATPIGASPASYNVHAVRRAVAEWDAQRLPFRLRLGADSLSADVHVVWTNRFDEPISGRTTCVHDGAGHIVSAEVVLALSHSDGRILSDEETRVLALHELGHAIGLDHSASSTSVMSPRVRVRNISDADRAAALRLYNAP